MLHYIIKKCLPVILCGVMMGGCLLPWLPAAAGETADGRAGELTFSFGEGGGIGILRLTLPAAAPSPAEEGVLWGLLWELRLPAGWSIGEATPAEGLTLTLSDPRPTGEGGSRLGILLDGEPTERGSGEGDGGEYPLMEFNFSRGEESGVPEVAGECALYILRKGEITVYPLTPRTEMWETTPHPPTGPSAPPSTEAATGSPAETATEPQTEPLTEPQTESPTNPPTESPAEAPPPPIETTAEAPPPPAEPPLFVGCQETPVTGGTFAVRFCFGEALGGVICLGGGVVTVETGVWAGEFPCGDREESTAGRAAPAVQTFQTVKTLQTVTFRGLRAEGEWRFLIDTKAGWITATYENGVFRGFSAPVTWPISQTFTPKIG